MFWKDTLLDYVKRRMGIEMIRSVGGDKIGMAEKKRIQTLIISSFSGLYPGSSYNSDYQAESSGHSHNISQHLQILKVW